MEKQLKSHTHKTLRSTVSQNDLFLKNRWQNPADLLLNSFCRNKATLRTIRDRMIKSLTHQACVRLSLAITVIRVTGHFSMI